jgi:invasion protein IalB
MQIIERRATRLFAGVLLAVIAGGAVAQQPAPRPPAPRPAPSPQTVQAQPPAPTETPQRTTATYADWIVQCETQAGPPPQKVCDMAQVAQVQVQGRSNPFSRVSIAHPVKGQPVKLVVQVPVNVAFATNVRVQTADADPGITAPFARCVPNGCFADFDIKDDILKKLRAASGAGKLSFADAGGHDVSVPLSFNGFAQAFEALAKE